MISKSTAANLAIALITMLPSSAFAQSDNPLIGPFWEIRGRWTWAPNEDARLGLYNSRAKAEAEMARIYRDYARGGLMEYAPNIRSLHR